MPITIRYQPDARVASDAAYELGYGQAAARQNALRAQMAQQIQQRGISNFASKRAAENRAVAQDRASRAANAEWRARQEITAGNRQEYQQQGIEGRGGLQEQRMAAAEKQLGRRLTAQENQQLIGLAEADWQKNVDRQIRQKEHLEERALQDEKNRNAFYAKVEGMIDGRKLGNDIFMKKSALYQELRNVQKIEDPEIRAREQAVWEDKRAKLYSSIELPPEPEEQIEKDIQEVVQNAGGQKVGPGMYKKDGILFESEIDSATGKVKWKPSSVKLPEAEKAKIEDERWNKILTDYDKYLDHHEDRVDKAALHFAGMTKKSLTGESSPLYTEEQAMAMARKLIGNPKPPPTKPGAPQEGGQGGYSPEQKQRGAAAMKAAKAQGITDPAKLAEIGRNAARGQ